MNNQAIRNHLRPVLDGKFFKIGDDRFYIKGTTYGTFAPDEKGEQFPPLEVVEKDFHLMSENGMNTVRTYTVPSIAVLDLALKYNLKVMVGMPWEQHLTFLESKKQAQQIINQLKADVLKCEKHPAIFCYSVGNEIPAPIVRWHGEKKITKFLYNLYRTVKDVDPDGLVTYVNYPTTEYLDLEFLDFNCFNVFLESKDILSKYLARLHNLTGDKPLLLAEVGLDSMRNGLERQAETLDWQIRTIFEKGCAGIFVFSWTDEWWRGGLIIHDWNFGIVDRNRIPKLALSTVKKAFSDVPFSPKGVFPKISVVVCSHNGSKTIRDTMEGLLRLDYPNFEVIVVNDGSNDDTPNIVSDYDVTVINTKNSGLSSARNTGLSAAKGEIIAYIDDDAYPDSQWLKYLASAYLNSNHAGIGGPNIPPSGDGPIADCVSNAPGGPVHVLISDEIAEHIPGCNMSFKRDALIEVGGFDPLYKSAGDDVDICWRIQNKGNTIGFHPSAFVWHHRRNSIRMYWKQQKGYGKAEALLERNWPEKYNSIGHLSWMGHIYGNGLTKPLKFGKKRIFFGAQGTALFQSVYQPASSIIKTFTLMPEWYFLIVLFGIVSLLGLEWRPLLLTIPVFIASILIVTIQAGMSATHTVFNDKPDTKRRKLQYWGLTSLLHVIQPIARLIGRVTHGLSPWREGFRNLKYMKDLLTSPKVIQHWSEKWKSLEEWLQIIEQSLIRLNKRIIIGGEFDDWDMQSRIGPFVSVRSLVTVEEYGMGKQNIKLKTKMIISKTGIVIFVALSVLSYLAFMSQAVISSIFFLLLAILLQLKILADTSYTVASINIAMRTLSDGINKEKNEQDLYNSNNIMNVIIPEFSLPNIKRVVLSKNAPHQNLKKEIFNYTE